MGNLSTSPRFLPPLVVPDSHRDSHLTPSLDTSYPSPESDNDDALRTPIQFFSNNYPPSVPLTGRKGTCGIKIADANTDGLSRLEQFSELTPWIPSSHLRGDFNHNGLPISCAPEACLSVTPIGLTDHCYGAAVTKHSSENFGSTLRANKLFPQNNLSHLSYNRDTSTSLTATAPLNTDNLNLKARSYSYRFPRKHLLNPSFVRSYCLGDELGCGGFGFVMTATHRVQGHEVAVKFIIKEKVPRQGWIYDNAIGKVPTEVMLLSCLDHENIVKCYDLFQDDLYFYLVQELHGSPWRETGGSSPRNVPAQRPVALTSPSTLPSAERPPQTISPSETCSPRQPQHCFGHIHSRSSEHAQIASRTGAVPYSHSLPARPEYRRRPSHDLFECIEQSSHRRLTEAQARYVFAQVVDAVSYLDQHGITHHDIKDENLVIDKDLRVKLIDFGSATITDPTQPAPFHTLFFGTTVYAAPEVLLKQPHQAPPAEIWTLGILLSYLLTGLSPWQTEDDIFEGRIAFDDGDPEGFFSPCLLDLIRRCLDPDPTKRANIREVRDHPWLVPM